MSIRWIEEVSPNEEWKNRPLLQKALLVSDPEGLPRRPKREKEKEGNQKE